MYAAISSLKSADSRQRHSSVPITLSIRTSEVALRGLVRPCDRNNCDCVKSRLLNDWKIASSLSENNAAVECVRVSRIFEGRERSWFVVLRGRENTSLP